MDYSATNGTSSVKLFNGDCNDVMATLDAESVNLVLTDPPYSTTYSEWEEPLKYDALWDELWRVCKPSAAVVMFSAQPFTTDLINSQRKHFKYEIIWRKNAGSDFMNAKRRPIRIHENICVFYKAQPTYNPQMTEGKKVTRKHEDATKASTAYRIVRSVDYASDKRYPKTVIDFDVVPHQHNIHVNQKPQELLRWLIRTYSNEGELVLDPFAGSSSCGVAAITEKRNWVGIEKNKDFYNKGKEWLDKTISQGRFDI